MKPEPAAQKPTAGRKYPAPSSTLNHPMEYPEYPIEHPEYPIEYPEYPIEYPEYPTSTLSTPCSTLSTPLNPSPVPVQPGEPQPEQPVQPVDLAHGHGGSDPLRLLRLPTRRLLRLPTDGRGPAAPCRAAEPAGGRGGMRRRRSLQRTGGGGPPRWTRLHASLSGEATLRNEGTALLCANPRACPRPTALVPTASSVPGPHAAPHILDRNPPAPAPNSAGVLDSTALSIGPLPRLMHMSIVNGRSRPFGGWKRQSADLGHRVATATERWPT
jgi:hypothetical protein